MARKGPNESGIGVTLDGQEGGVAGRLGGEREGIVGLQGEEFAPASVIDGLGRAHPGKSRTREAEIGVLAMDGLTSSPILEGEDDNGQRMVISLSL